MSSATFLPPRSRAEIDLGILRSNLAILHKFAERGVVREQGARAKFLGCVPMVKANAYGHGLVPVGRALDRARQTTALGVAAVAEAYALREWGVRKPIWVFSECSPIHHDTAGWFGREEIEPVLHRLDHLEALVALAKKNRIHRKLKFHLKFNTGMNRLGIELSELARVESLLETSGLRPEGICTHFADAEAPGSSRSHSQSDRFCYVAGALTRFAPKYIHGANSAGLIEGNKVGLDVFCNVVRPGIALYGYPPFLKRGLEKIRPALKWKAQVVSTRDLKKGDRVGYGFAGVARGGPSYRQAVLAVGYGDGFSRSNSNSEILVQEGHSRRLARMRVLGRVSMDLLSLEASGKVRVGDWFTLLGAAPEQGLVLAHNQSTIMYEVLTALSLRVERSYLNGALK